MPGLMYMRTKVSLLQYTLRLPVDPSTYMSMDRRNRLREHGLQAAFICKQWNIT
jgi:hypothetical protein